MVNAQRLKDEPRFHLRKHVTTLSAEKSLTKLCAHCGRPFFTTTATARFCSLTSTSRGRPRAAEHPCKGCGKPTARPTWCGGGCRANYRKQQREREAAERKIIEAPKPAEDFDFELRLIRSGLMPPAYALAPDGRPTWSLGCIALLLNVRIDALVQILAENEPRFATTADYRSGLEI